jgi:hypothetical protein
MTYVGIAWHTDLISTSFAPPDMYRSAQLVNHLDNLCFVDLNWSFFTLPSGVGRPRYFSSWGMFCTPRMDLTVSLFSSVQAVLKNIEHLVGFIS